MITISCLDLFQSPRNLLWLLSTTVLIIITILLLMCILHCHSGSNIHPFNNPLFLLPLLLLLLLLLPRLPLPLLLLLPLPLFLPLLFLLPRPLLLFLPHFRYDINEMSDKEYEDFIKIEFRPNPTRGTQHSSLQLCSLLLFCSYFLIFLLSLLLSSTFLSSTVNMHHCHKSNPKY